MHQYNIQYIYRKLSHQQPVKYTIRNATNTSSELPLDIFECERHTKSVGNALSKQLCCSESKETTEGNSLPLVINSTSIPFNLHDSSSLGGDARTFYRWLPRGLMSLSSTQRIKRKALKHGRVL